MTDTGRQTALVVGGGAVGICCGLYLQRAGFRVVIVERDAPMSGCSSGNSGNLGMASCIPYSTPGIWRSLPAMLTDPLSALDIGWAHAPRALRFFIGFLRSSRTAVVADIADNLASLQKFVFAAYEELLGSTAYNALIERRGRLLVHERRSSFEASRLVNRLREERGVRVIPLARGELHEMEPSLGPQAQFAYFTPESGHCINPSRLGKELSDRFLKQGGQIVTATVLGFRMGADGIAAACTDGEELSADLFVVAAGAFSAPLARQLGANVCLEPERGYHHMVASPNITVNRPMILQDRYVAVTPMEHGLRFATGSEFRGIGTPPRFDLADRIIESAQRLFPDLKAQNPEKWSGYRPATPDGMPVIGRAPNARNALFAFGHGHVGLSTAAISGKIIAQMAVNQAPDVNPFPFRATRF